MSFGPAPQGSARFREWRARGETLLRSFVPAAARYCGGFAPSAPECAVAEAAACRRAAEVLRFGSGTFSAFLVGDDDDRPPSTQWLTCPDVEAEARRSGE